MILFSVLHLQGDSKKTGKPYDVMKLDGVEYDYFNGIPRSCSYMISVPEFARNESELLPGAKVEVLRSGQVLIQDTHAFDIQLLLAALGS